MLDIETVPEAMLVLDPVLDQVQTMNRQACKLLMVDKTKALEQPVSHLFGAGLGALISFTQEVIDKGHAKSEELMAVLPNGDELSLEVMASLNKHTVGTQINFLIRDKNWFQKWRVKNSAHKQHDFGLMQWQRIHDVFQQLEKENQLILSAAGEGIYGVDADGNTTFANPAAERVLGWKADELLGQNAHAMIHHSHTDGSDYSVHDCPIYAAFKDGAVRQVDNEVFWSKAGSPVPVEYTSTPILDNGRLVGAVVVFRDISDRKEAESKLRNALEEVETLKQKLEMENAYLLEELSAGYNAYQIVGRSPAIQRVIHQIQLVAPTDATVLITGESGTGKELIARAIHTASDRSERPLVRVNCAAIPADLFESEFFGHVRGAFSGAVQDRLGRFQVADGGTLFLDEVGEIPLILQGKLLRVLQDSEFERVGESVTRKVDVRVIAATNRNLEALVKEGKFREDLYFRLNVFPVCSVSLRERKEDLPLLISYFLKRICQRFNKPELTVTRSQMQTLQQYQWPGNIRELENLIERNVIVSRGKRLELDHLPEAAFVQKNTEALPNLSPPEAFNLTENDCQALRYQSIIGALKKAKGKLYGDNGAAVILGIKPTTLASRIKKMGIDKTLFASG